MRLLTTSKELTKIKRNERKWVREPGDRLSLLKAEESLKREHTSEQAKPGKSESRRTLQTKSQKLLCGKFQDRETKRRQTPDLT